MIGIIDYGMGNLGSVGNACAFLEIPSRILTKPADMASCRAVILPGVGAFGDCMKHLGQHGFMGVLRGWIGEGQPFLGICLGLQALYEGSEESPGVPGLGILPGTVKRFRLPPEWKVPQIGWNRVRQARADCPLFAGVPDGSYCYFVHSYYAEADGEATAGLTSYGLDYASAVWKKNVMATQFHLEKSQQVGLTMLKNFWAWVEAGAKA